jgi:CcmD family protein
MGYLAAGFIALWLLVTLYVVFISMRQRRLEVELAGLEESLNVSEAGNN